MYAGGEGGGGAHRGLASAFSFTSTGLAAPKGLGFGPLLGTTGRGSLGSSLVSEAPTEAVTEGVAEGARARGGKAADLGFRANRGLEPPAWLLGNLSRVSARRKDQLPSSVVVANTWPE